MLRMVRARLPLVVRRALAEPLLLAAAFGSILLATTAISALLLHAGSATQAGVRRALETAPLAATATVVTSSVTAGDFAAADRAVRAGIAHAHGEVPVRVTVRVESASYALKGQDRGDVQPVLTRFAAYEGLDGQADLVSGSWPAETKTALVEVALSEPAARAMGVAAGDEFTVVGRLDGKPARVRVTGVFRLRDPDDPRWKGEELLRFGTRTGDFTSRGPLVVPTGTFLDRFATGVSARWLAEPDLRRLSPDRLRPFSASVAGTSGAVRAGCPRCTVTETLSGTLLRLDRGALVARSTMLVPVLQLLVLSAYALALTARLLAEHRRMETALLRSRGGGSPRLAAMAAGEALLIALPCAPAAPFLAPVLLRLVSAFPWIEATGVEPPRAPDGSTFAVAAAVALACAAMLAAPPLLAARRTYVEEQAARGRADRPGLVQRAGADVALLVLAALAVWRLRGQDAPETTRLGGELGLDPLVGAGPALALLCGGMAALRLVPAVARVAERATRRRPGFGPALAARQVSRRPARYSGPALLLTMATAIGVLSLTTAATWRGAQEDRARHLAGAGLRVPALPGDDAGTFTTLPGVAAAVPAHRARVVADGADATLIAADAAHLGRVLLLRPDLSELSPATLASRIAGSGGQPLPVVVTPGLADTVRITAGTAAIPIKVVGVVAAMPGTPEGTPALLADLSALRAAGAKGAEWPVTEWWLAADGHDTTRAAVLAASWRGRGDVVDVAALTAGYRDDPTAAGLQGALLLGFAAALAFAVLGFLVNAAVSARERRGEFAVLGALSVSFRQTLGLLAVEQSFVVGLSLAGGVALAVAVSAAVVPPMVTAGYATGGGLPVLLHVPWPQVAALAVAVLVVLLVIVAGLARSLHRREPAAVLRAGEAS
ncbi:FtsX-like permease family protein [Microbispora catharanthi]|uniref:FtsX-like permease family protein n=1 Tax=Microbispora catharanthi TaxID=1712871 RepID=A0A5N6C4V9_9ACTN|nr:FtsX-like permease family protein [Microbispora catharanthi]KAB8187845.1 FtsX-like permease family protein [Microbispora catharanthi]